jgi:predicted nuclease of predicted toxin-antitoxin system
MKARPIIVDHCCPRKLADYLQSRGNVVLYISDSRPDKEIVALAHNMGAYIVTADNGASDGDMSFREYQNTYLIRPDKKYKHVYHDLKVLMKTEIEGPL